MMQKRRMAKATLPPPLGYSYEVLFRAQTPQQALHFVHTLHRQGRIEGYSVRSFKDMQKDDLTGVKIIIGRVGSLAEVDRVVDSLLLFMNGFHHFEIVRHDSSRVPDNAPNQEHPRLAMIVCEDADEQLPVPAA